MGTIRHHGPSDLSFRVCLRSVHLSLSLSFAFAFAASICVSRPHSPFAVVNPCCRAMEQLVGVSCDPCCRESFAQKQQCVSCHDMLHYSSNRSHCTFTIITTTSSPLLSCNIIKLGSSRWWCNSLMVVVVGSLPHRRFIGFQLRFRLTKARG